MDIRDISPTQFDRLRGQIIRFFRTYGDKRITHKGLRWLRQLPSVSFNDGTIVVIATDNNRLVGITVIGQYGLEESLIAVHPHFRKHGVGKMMVRHVLQQLGRLYGRVATDNTPSLKLCFAMGMVAFDLFSGVTGKPTLWLGTGNWSREEAERYMDSG